jgi:hypothetical protein
LKKTVAVFLLGFVVGVFATWVAPGFWEHLTYKRMQPQPPGVCYSCLFGDAALRADLINFYRQYKTADPLVAADVEYMLWRATGSPNCDALYDYRKLADSDPVTSRRLMAAAILAFGGPECGRDPGEPLEKASTLAKENGRPWEAAALRQIARERFKPKFEDVTITGALSVPPGAKSMVLGESTIKLTPGMRVGTQVDRVVRDWISYQLKWNLTDDPVAGDAVLWYHEGAVVKRMLQLAPVKVYPLAGTLVAKRGDKWFGPDETGVFRFELLEDKMEYPTSHSTDSVGWIEDTHGVSAVVSQALEREVQLVVACGDAEAKAKAAFYLAQKGVSVLFPGDRFADLLLGYQAKGVLLGTAPVKKVEGKAVIGHQPVRFSLQEPIVVEDTKQIFPIQYYDAGARYFRRLNSFVPLKLEFVNIDAPNQIERVLQRAAEIGSSAVAVRVFTKQEDAALRAWLHKSPRNRAILFHSGLYAYAQPLFDDFPNQVTFGDLHPRFE